MAFSKALEHALDVAGEGEQGVPITEQGKVVTTCIKDGDFLPEFGHRAAERQLTGEELLVSERKLDVLFDGLELAQTDAEIIDVATKNAPDRRIGAVRRSPLGFGMLIKRRPMDDEALRGYLAPFLADRGVRRDALKVLRGISSRQTIEAAERLRSFDRPTLIAWAPEDRFFKLRFAERLASDIPNARLVRIEDSLTFVPEDQPERLAEEIAGFMAETKEGARAVSSG